MHHQRLTQPTERLTGSRFAPRGALPTVPGAAEETAEKGRGALGVAGNPKQTAVLKGFLENLRESRGSGRCGGIAGCANSGSGSVASPVAPLWCEQQVCRGCTEPASSLQKPRWSPAGEACAGGTGTAQGLAAGLLQTQAPQDWHCRCSRDSLLQWVMPLPGQWKSNSWSTRLASRRPLRRGRQAEGRKWARYRGSELPEQQEQTAPPSCSPSPSPSPADLLREGTVFKSLRGDAPPK